MAFEVTCPACHGVLRVEETAAGGLVRCGSCLTVIRVPEAGGATSEPTPPPPVAQRPPEEPSERLEAVPIGEETPRPRRRRRRPPPEPGHGALFWIVIVFGVLIVGSCACCGGIYLLLPGAKWRTHESTRGGFRVEFPAEPRTNMPIPGLVADPDVQTEGAILWKRGEFFVVWYRAIVPARQRVETDQQLLAEAERGIEREPEVQRIVSKKPITVSGFPGIEIEYVARDGGNYVARVIVADQRMYALVGGGRFVGPGNANVRRFLDSFAVTNARLQPKLPPRDPLDPKW